MISSYEEDVGLVFLTHPRVVVVVVRSSRAANMGIRNSSAHLKVHFANLNPNKKDKKEKERERWDSSSNPTPHFCSSHLLLLLNFLGTH